MNAGRIDGIKPIGIDDKQVQNMKKKPDEQFRDALAGLLSGVQNFAPTVNGPINFGKSGNDAATTGI